MTEETINNTSIESEEDAIVNERDAADDQDDIPCLDTGTVEEELVCLDETVTALEERLAAAEDKAAEYRDGWQRAQAAFANYRKRTEAEQAHWRSAANANLLTRLLPVLDDFQRAFDALPSEFAGHSWLSGISLIQRKVRAILDSESVTAIELDSGDSFDPLYHQAVVYQEVEGFEDGQIVAEVETGYMLGDRVLRPSMVVVAKAPARKAQQKIDQQSATENVSAEVMDEIIEGEVIASEPDEVNPDATGNTDVA